MRWSLELCLTFRFATDSFRSFPAFSSELLNGKIGAIFQTTSLCPIRQTADAISAPGNVPELSTTRKEWSKTGIYDA